MTTTNSTRGWRGIRLRWFVLAALMLFVCAATVYAVRWYHGFYHHVTREELSHEVKHSSFQATIRSGPPINLQLYQQENARSQPLVLFTSGDGGWSPFCADVAAHIAATGMTVVGIDVKEYLVHFATTKNPISPEQLATDYATIGRLSMVQPGVADKEPLILAGWSLGAGYSVIAATQPEFSLKVSRVVAISLPTYGELAWRPTDALIYLTHGRPHDPVFDARQYLKKLSQTPIVFVNATKDDTAPFNEAKLLFEAAPGSKRVYLVQASGHHFEGGEKEFYQYLDQGLSVPQIADKSDKKLKEPVVAGG